MIRLDARVYRRLKLKRRRFVLWSALKNSRSPHCASHSFLEWEASVGMTSCWRAALQASLTPEAGAVVGHGEYQKNEEEEYGGDDDQLEELFVSAFEVH